MTNIILDSYEITYRILKVGLAVKNIQPFQQLSEESSVQTRMLTPSDIGERNFIY